MSTPPPYEIEAKVVAMRNAGRTWWEIAKALSISASRAADIHAAAVSAGRAP